MATFRTEIHLPLSTVKIDYNTGIMFMGSCFTENIGHKMTELKMRTDVNPFGTLYNPASIKNSIDILLAKKTLTEQDIFLENNQWHSFSHHSRFSNEDKNLFLEGVNSRILSSSEFIKKAEFLILTFGTSWVYRLKKTACIVSNCHKIPAREFTREFLDSSEVFELFSELINRLKKINPLIKIIFTVSPIRHWKDGATDNMHSKASLLVAIHRLVNSFQDTFYFPAFEIMMDDLRDYRFYNEDMLHPSSVAINYIWSKFADVYFTNETRDLQSQVESVQKSLAHRPFNSSGESYKLFVSSTLEKIKFLEKKYSFLNFEKEKKLLDDSF